MDRRDIAIVVTVIVFVVVIASALLASSPSSLTVEKGHIYRVEFAQDQVVCYAYSNWSDDAVSLYCIDKLTKRNANGQ